MDDADVQRQFQIKEGLEGRSMLRFAASSGHQASSGDAQTDEEEPPAPKLPPVSAERLSQQLASQSGMGSLRFH